MAYTTKPLPCLYGSKLKLRFRIPEQGQYPKKIHFNANQLKFFKTSIHKDILKEEWGDPFGWGSSMHKVPEDVPAKKKRRITGTNIINNKVAEWICPDCSVNCPMWETTCWVCSAKATYADLAEDIVHSNWHNSPKQLLLPTGIIKGSRDDPEYRKADRPFRKPCGCSYSSRCIHIIDLVHQVPYYERICPNCDTQSPYQENLCLFCNTPLHNAEWVDGKNRKLLHINCDDITR